MINVKAIDHICLWVTSLQESKDYYEKLFGLVCTPREDDKSTLSVESESIHFFMSESKNEDEFIHKQHLSFEVESLDSVIETLHKMGISDYKRGKVTFFVHKNYQWCEWKDPSGIRLECVEIL